MPADQTEQDIAQFFEDLMRQDPSMKLLVARGDGTYATANRLIFHGTLMLWDMHDWAGSYERYCYRTTEMAEAAILEWQSRNWEGEPIGWHRHPTTGRRRENGDPTKEYIAW